MKLSVIVTTYNRPDALKKVLEALVAQTRIPDEILVADDGSGPGTEAMLTAFENRSGPVFSISGRETGGFGRPWRGTKRSPYHRVITWCFWTGIVFRTGISSRTIWLWRSRGVFFRASGCWWMRSPLQRLI